MDNLPVLIVGAGPTGLMMACQLARYGINFRIIDKKPEPTQASNATWIQTRTLELFDQMGIAEYFIKIGHPCSAINFYIDGKQSAILTFKDVNSIYPFILMLPQSETEKILEKYLIEFNKNVERPLELIDIKFENDTVISTLKHSDGRIENIISNWLVACDGANSIVREKCGFHFPGEDLKEQFMVADATIDFTYMPKDEIHFFFDPGTVLAAFPLGKNKYRIAANLHLDYPRKFYSEREVIELVQERAHGKYYVTDVAWISSFWIHGKIAEHMRKGPIFLAGDAAHIHSPAGGQGMNTGIQDAYNLAWKLAFVIQRKAKASLLDSYEIERYPIVEETINQNEHFTKIALFDKDFLSKLEDFSKDLSDDRDGNLTKKIGNQITQIDIQYKNSPIINYKNDKNLYYAGKRLPNIIINQKTLYHYLNNTQYNILLFIGLNPSEKELMLINDVQKNLEKNPDLFKLLIISKDKFGFSDNVLLDENSNIQKYLGIKKSTILIVRPDTYIAYYSESFDWESIKIFFETYLNI